MKRIFFFTVTLLAFLSMHAQNSPKKLTALVLAIDDHAPIKDATINLLPRGESVQSKSNGSFEITINSPLDSLVISHANFTSKRIAVSDLGSPAIIQLVPLSKQLEEVQVNTGYQALPKERSTGSFEKISNQLFNQQVSTSVLERLETIANGLYVEKKTNQAVPAFTIRGLSTIQGPKPPLVILDNFPYEGNLNNINPNDVESVTLLKDAAAASIWGTRAGNGVIVITTKKAKFNQPLRIEINSNITIAEKPDLWYYNNITSTDFVGLEQFLYSKGYYNSAITSSSRPPLSPVVELLIKKANGSLPAAEADEKIKALGTHDLRNDFDNYVYQAAVNKQAALTVRGSGNNIAYLFSAGYDNNIGSLHDKYNRLVIRSENNYKINNRLQLSSGIIYTQTNNKEGRLGYNSFGASNGSLPIYTRLADDAGNPIPVIRQYRQPYLDTAGAGKLLDWNWYPLTEQDYITNNNRTQSFIGNLGLSFRIAPGISTDIKYQYEKQGGDNVIRYDQQSFFARDLVNTYSQLNRNTGVVTYRIPKGGVINNSTSLLQAHNFRAQLNISKKWGRHELNTIAGTEIRELVSKSNSFRAYGYNGDILSFASVDYANSYPNFVTGSTSFIPNNVSFNEKLNRYVSFYANAAYTYNSRYSLTLSGRRDASNLFGVRTNDKWNPLWSAGLGWEITKEKFYNFKPVPFLKLRATYGISGNADPSRSGFTVLSYSLTSPYTLLPTARIDQFTNPGLRWEKVAMLNLGLDFRAFANRLQGSVEYYHKKAKDLLGSASVDYTAVATYRLIRNIASMKGSGWDISLNSINIQSPVLWTSNLNFNTNKDKVVDYYLATRLASSYLNAGLNISALAGRPVYGIYAYKWAGLDPLTGDPMGFVNGKPSKDYNTLTGSTYLVDSLEYMGRAFPAIFGSLGNTISYKGLSLTVRFSWKLGYYFMRNSVYYSNLFASRQGHGDYALRWQKPGDELFTNVPSLVYPAQSRRDIFYNNAEILVEKADHIRLQYITLAYDFKRLFPKLRLTNLDLYANVNNLGIIWRANKHGIDPDYRDNSILPSKNIALGVKVGL